jgi:hypothetical protein
MSEPVASPSHGHSAFQQAIEAIETLSRPDQGRLRAILYQRLRDRRRQQLVQEIAEVRQEYAQGNVQFGTVTDFLAKLDR